MHALGLAVFQKNDSIRSPRSCPTSTAILDEECNKYSECDTLAPYVAAGKPAWNAEYSEDGESTRMFCTADVGARDRRRALFNLSLDGTVFQPCSNDVGVRN